MNRTMKINVTRETGFKSRTNIAEKGYDKTTYKPLNQRNRRS